MSEGEVKIWDVDRKVGGSHCIKTLKYTTSRFYERHFRSMALASLVSEDDDDDDDDDDMAKGCEEPGKNIMVV